LSSPFGIIVAIVAIVAVVPAVAIIAIVAAVAVVATNAIALFAPAAVALAAVIIALAVIATTVLAIAAYLVPSWLLCPLSPSSIGEVSIITLVALTLVALNPLTFFVTLVAVVFTPLTVAFRGCLLSAANARPFAARLSSTDAEATAASCPPAEPLLPFVALYFIMADCYVIASAPAPSSHCCSHRHHCHCFVIVTYRPSALTEEFIQKKKKAEKVYFYLCTTNWNKQI
jgi:hypothetical protein